MPRRVPVALQSREDRYKLLDAEEQPIAYVYTAEGDPTVGKTLTFDEARRIASNIAKLAELLKK